MNSISKEDLPIRPKEERLNKAWESLSRSLMLIFLNQEGLTPLDSYQKVGIVGFVLDQTGTIVNVVNQIKVLDLLKYSIKAIDVSEEQQGALRYFLDQYLNSGGMNPDGQSYWNSTKLDEFHSYYEGNFRLPLKKSMTETELALMQLELLEEFESGGRSWN